MHASLASIGRACTVEDEEPPETPTHSSIDSQTDYFEQCLKPPGWTVRELVEKTSGLVSNSILVWPYSDRNTREEAISGDSKEVDASTLQNESASIDQYPPTPIPPAAEVHLDRLTRLHRLCELARRTFQLDSLTSTYSELSGGLASLSTHSDNIASKEYELLEATLSDYSRVYSSPLPTRSNRSNRLDQHPVEHSGPAGTTDSHPFDVGADSGYSFSRFRTPATSNPSQLSELRVICESLRQCLTQIKHFFHEQQNTGRLVRQFIPSPNINEISVFVSPTQTITSDTNRFTSATLISAHHLIYSGLSLLAHTDITRYTHGELWEMTRGIEELDILNRQLQTACRVTYSESVCDMLMGRGRTHDSMNMLLNVITRCELLYDPVLVACPISIGYLFTLIAYQRSIRVAHAIFQQLSAVRSFEQEKSAGISGLISASTQSGPLTLVEAFRAYLTQNYDRTASEYLRNEYEFIAGFLDVLSQSTNLLYQVQKLKLLCSAAAAAQAKKTELDRQHQQHRFFKPTTGSTSSNAVSVEGVHGILVKRISVGKESSSAGSSSASKTVTVANKISRCVRRGSGSKKNAVSQYQETLHRAGTLDRYVATGSVNCPLSPTDQMQNEDSKEMVEHGSASIPAASTETKHPNTVGPKKVVQWSDHREISTRHQVIGRFLEMTWRYTEAHFTNLFMCPPVAYVTSEQASSLSDQSSAKTNGSDLTVSGIGCRCTTMSCLLMKPEQIRTLSGYIREVAKPDLFPAGLIPALKRQALRLEELAHRRSWFTDVRHNNSLPSPKRGRFGVDDHGPAKTRCDNSVSSVISSPNNSEPTFMATTNSASVVPNSERKETVEPKETATGVPSLNHLPKGSCASSYLRDMKNKMRSSCFSLCPTCLPKHIGWPVLSSELKTIFRLAVDLMTYFTKDRRKLDSLIHSVNQKLKEFDFTTSFKQPSTINAELSNQPDVLLQSAYDISRRLNLSFHRFYLYNKSIMQHLTQRISCAMRCTCTSIFGAEQSCLISKVSVVALAVAELIQLLDFVELLCHIIDVVVDVMRAKFSRSYQGNLPHFTTTNISEPVQELDANLMPVQSGVGSVHVKIQLPNGIRLARILATLKRLHVQIKETRSAIPEIIFSCTQMCTTNFSSALDQTTVQQTALNVLDKDSTPIWQTSTFMDTFVRGLLTVLPPCFLEVPSGNLDSDCTQPPNKSPHLSSTCMFHQTMYKQVLGQMFGRFCSEWLNEQSRVRHAGSPKPLSSEYINAVERLRSLMMENRQVSSVELLAVLCDCPEFQQLLASTSHRANSQQVNMMEVTGAENSTLTNTASPLQSPLPELTQEPRVKTSSNPANISRQFSSVMSPPSMMGKFSSRLNSPGGTLAAFAAGVKNSIFIPFKQISTPDNATCSQRGTVLEPTTSVEMIYSAVKSPSRGSNT